MLSNPIWVEVDCVGEDTQTKYFGKFLVRPFLTIKEKTEVNKTFGKYSLGVPFSENNDQLDTRFFLNTLAFFKVAVVESDCDWWKGDEPGMDLLDVEPIFTLLDKYTQAKRALMPKKEGSNGDSNLDTSV